MYSNTTSLTSAGLNVCKSNTPSMGRGMGSSTDGKLLRNCQMESIDSDRRLGLNNITAMRYSIEPMTMADYDEVLRLWETTEGVGLNESDSRPAIAAYLKRNRGMS